MADPLKIEQLVYVFCHCTIFRGLSRH